MNPIDNPEAFQLALNHQPRKVGDRIAVMDDELGRVEGVIVSFGRDDAVRVSFNGEPAIIIFEDMIL